MIRYIKTNITLLLMITMGTISGQQLAAQADTLSLYRDFLGLCTEYQRAPLQLDLSYKSGNNLVLNPQDTMSMQGQFSITGNGVYYLHMGDVEQYIDDTLAMMINHTYHQVMISQNAASARRLLDRYMGSITNDTSVQTLIEAYRIVQQNVTGNAYQLTSRINLPGTTIARQSINLRYDPVKREPLEVITTRRSLVAVEPADSLAFAQKFAGQQVLVSLPNAGLYFVRTYTATFTYQDIKHEDAVSIPLLVSDYIRKSNAGEYELMPAKSEYRLSVE